MSTAQPHHENLPSTELATARTAGPPAEMATAWLTPQSLEAGLALADMMSKAGLVPEHLRGKPGDCLMVISQAARWRMDPFAVAQCTAVVRGKLCYEGKLVAAVLTSMRAIEGRLRYDFKGEGLAMSVVVTGTPRGGEPVSIAGTVKDWKTDNGNWTKDPQMMLIYRGTRQWARAYVPDAMLGVYTPDEMEDSSIRTVEGTVTGTRPSRFVRDEMPTAGPSAAAIAAPSPATPEDLLACAKDLHADFGPAGAAQLKVICAELGIAKVQECPADKIETALARVKGAYRELHEATADRGSEKAEEA